MKRLIIIQVLVLLASIFGFSYSAHALSSSELNSIYGNSVWYDPDSGTGQDELNFCLGGPGGSGPLYGPHFPQVSDTAALSSAIRDYITKTVPNSPLKNFSDVFVGLGQQYDVNPALAVAMAQKETSLGTAGYGTPSGGYNITNIRPNGSFARYSSYNEGIEATYKNLSGSLYLGPPTNYTTVSQIINRWAPPSDNNDTSAYVQFVGDVMKEILGKVTGGAAGPQVDSCTNTTGSVSTSGYAFPVAPQTKSQNGGVPNLSPLPCNDVTACHHDGTPAFDIGRQPGGDSISGTPVYAISDGEISTLHTYMGISGCYSLQLHSSKDNYWYWYGHIQNVRVKNGDTVKAGQQVAEIGLRKCTANGSDPHLHIDRGCVINGVPQKGGLESCRDPGIVPIINQLYEELPA